MVLFLLVMFELFIFMAWFLFLWWIFGDLFRSRDIGGVAKIVSVLFIIIILPILGMLVYLLARGHGMTQRSLETQQHPQRRQGEYIPVGHRHELGRADRLGKSTSSPALTPPGTTVQQSGPGPALGTGSG